MRYHKVNMVVLLILSIILVACGDNEQRVIVIPTVTNSPDMTTAPVTVTKTPETFITATPTPVSSSTPIPTTIADSPEEDPIAELIKTYVEAMKTGSAAALIAPQTEEGITDIGLDTDIYSYEARTSSADNKEQTASNDLKTSEDILKDQYNYVIKLFGQDAWENVEYKLETAHYGEKETKYFNKLTNEYVTSEENDQIYIDYYNNLAKELGVVMVDSLDTTPYSGPIEGRKEYSIAAAISDGYFPPVEVRFEDKYDSYYVIFTFNGKSMAETKEFNFFIVIDNKDGNYRIFQGLRWYFPDKDDSDI